MIISLGIEMVFDKVILHGKSPREMRYSGDISQCNKGNIQVHAEYRCEG